MVVYEIKNLINGKRYIGSTVNKRKRWRRHRNWLQDNKHSNNHLQNAWNKYGEENFEFSVLEKVGDEDNLLDKEQEYLDKEDPEYNVAIDAKASMRGISGEDHPWYGAKHTEEAKKKMSEAHKGKKLSEKTKDKISEAHRDKDISREIEEKIIKFLPDEVSGENNPFYGKKHSEETKEKMSEAHKNKMRGEDNPKSKLTKKKVKVIKYLLKGEHFTQEEIGGMFGVSGAHIGKISRNESWTHVSIKG